MQEAIIERLKAYAPAPGVLQCAKCGGRTVMTTTTDASIDENGRYKRGQIVEDRICYDCDRQGIWSPMMPQTPRVTKEPKPRRQKPKIVK